MWTKSEKSIHWAMHLLDSYLIKWLSVRDKILDSKWKVVTYRLRMACYDENGNLVSDDDSSDDGRELFSFDNFVE